MKRGMGSLAAQNSDVYAWVGVDASGVWNDPANWRDLTNGLADVPGSPNNVTFGLFIADPAQLTVTGSGSSASLEVADSLNLQGVFVTGFLGLLVAQQTHLGGSLTVIGSTSSLSAQSASASGQLAIAGGATVLIAHNYGAAPSQSASIPTASSLSIDGKNSNLAVNGTLFADGAASITATNGGYLRAAAASLSTTSGDVGSYRVDDLSTIEVGMSGDAAPGTWTVDKGARLTLEGANTLTAPLFVVAGEVFDNGHLTLAATDRGVLSDIIGTGQVDIEAGRALILQRAEAPLTVYFAGSGGSLELTDGASAFASTIRGLAVGDSITVDGATVTNAYWLNGVLTLQDGTRTVGTIRMAGSYGGSTFAASGDTVTLSGPPNSDTYYLQGSDWDSADSWIDEKTGKGGVPGAENAVYVEDSSDLFGVGRCSSIDIQSGGLTLQGRFETGALSSNSYEYQPVMVAGKGG